MPVFMDVHENTPQGATAKDVAFGDTMRPASRQDRPSAVDPQLHGGRRGVPRRRGD